MRVAKAATAGWGLETPTINPNPNDLKWLRKSRNCHRRRVATDTHLRSPKMAPFTAGVTVCVLFTLLPLNVHEIFISDFTRALSANLSKTPCKLF